MGLEVRMSDVNVECIERHSITAVCPECQYETTVLTRSIRIMECGNCGLEMRITNLSDVPDTSWLHTVANLQEEIDRLRAEVERLRWFYTIVKKASDINPVPSIVRAAIKQMQDSEEE